MSTARAGKIPLWFLWALLAVVCWGLWAITSKLIGGSLTAAQSQALAELAQRTMQLQVTVQDGSVWVGDGQRSVELAPHRLNPR